jgi:hypothetical protein
MHHHHLTQGELRDEENWFKHHNNNRYNNYHAEDFFMMLCDEKSNKTIIMPVLMIIVFLIVPILVVDLTGIIKASQNLDQINKACGSSLFIFIVVHSIFNLVLFFGYLFMVILNNSEQDQQDGVFNNNNTIPKFALVLVSFVVHIVWVSAAIIVITTAVQSHDNCASGSVWLCATGYTNLTINALHACFSFLACLCFFPERITAHDHYTTIKPLLNDEKANEEKEGLIIAKHPKMVAPHPTAGPTTAPRPA